MCIRDRVCWLLTLLVFTAVPVAVAHDDPFDAKNLPSPEGAGVGGPFPAYNMQVLSHVPFSEMAGPSRGNDIWGWTDPLDSREYALVGLNNGTQFIDVTDPAAPINLGHLPSHKNNSTWRDIKVYANHAYIVADNAGNHGMQVFDLTQLRGVVTPQTFTNTAHFGYFREAHNVAINEDTGFLYAVGTNEDSGGILAIDLDSPAAPVLSGVYADDGYTHDAQVVVYDGPDATHVGKEIAFAFNEDTVTIVDVTNKLAPVQLSRQGYADGEYVHQGWLTEDHKYLLQNDELDERNIGAITTTRTHIWDVQDLDALSYMGYYEADVASIDHNLYTHNGLAYLANYTTGLRVLDLSDIENGHLEEVAYVDTHPLTDDVSKFDGVWSVYPYFDSGTVIIGDRDEGLIVARLTIAEPPYTPGDANRDGLVNLTDLTILAINFEKVDALWGEGDFTRDRVVDLSDLTTLAINFDTVSAGMTFGQALEQVGLSGAVPEPGTLAVILTGTSAVCSRRRRRPGIAATI